MKSLLASVLAVALGATGAAAQTYPTRPITIIAPTPPGGPPDTLARLLSDRAKGLGQPIVVENVTGAGGTLGVARAARAAPDGHTLSIGHLNSHVISSLTYPGVADLVRELEPIVLLTTAPMIFVGRSGLPGGDVRELIAWLKANPDKGTFGSVGVGGPARLWATHFQNSTGVRFQFVPYRGAVLVVQDLLAGQIDFGMMEASNLAAQLRGDRLRFYAVLTKERWPVAPQIPTIEEAGGPPFTMPFWHGLWAPKGTPKEIVAKLNAVVIDALADPLTQARLAQTGHATFPRAQLTPEALGAHHKAEFEKWWPIIQAAGLKAE